MQILLLFINRDPNDQISLVIDEMRFSSQLWNSEYTPTASNAALEFTTTKNVYQQIIDECQEHFEEWLHVVHYPSSFILALVKSSEKHFPVHLLSENGELWLAVDWPRGGATDQSLTNEKPDIGKEW